MIPENDNFWCVQIDFSPSNKSQSVKAQLASAICSFSDMWVEYGRADQQVLLLDMQVRHKVRKNTDPDFLQIGKAEVCWPAANDARIYQLLAVTQACNL